LLATLERADGQATRGLCIGKVDALRLAGLREAGRDERLGRHRYAATRRSIVA
jgi:hypothetical protein